MKNKTINKIFTRGIGITTSPILNNTLNSLKIKNKYKKDFSIITKIKQFYREQGIIWTISATESLKIIIKFISCRKGGKPVIGFPTYFCNEVLESIKDLCNIKFYEINESKKSLIAGENYIDEMKNLNFDIKNI